MIELITIILIPILWGFTAVTVYKKNRGAGFGILFTLVPIFLYFTLYLLTIGLDTMDIFGRGYSLWIAIPTTIARAVTITAIIQYILNITPDNKKILWRFFILLLIAIDIIRTYYSIYIFDDPYCGYDNAIILIGGPIFFLILLMPSWYICFKHAYTK